MSSSDDETDIINTPDGATCLKRCNQFSEITGGDSALAHFMLQECQWDLEMAIENFLTRSGASQLSVNATSSSSSATKIVELDSGDDDRSNKLDGFTVCSWNIDGLDRSNLMSRTKAVIQELKRGMFQVIFLQEVVPETFSLIDNAFSTEYFIHSGSENCALVPYFTCMFVSKKVFGEFKARVINFSSSQMGRNIILAEAQYGNQSIMFMTSHLESTKEHEKTRVEQLRTCFSKMQDHNPSSTVVFAGDLNLRNPEEDKAGGIPKGIVDVWNNVGAPKDCQYTWDMMKNTNHEFQRFKPRCRFDRMYLKSTVGNGCTCKAKSMKLIGTNIVRSCLAFPSDHFGIVGTFEMVYDK